MSYNFSNNLNELKQQHKDLYKVVACNRKKIDTIYKDVKKK